LKKLINLWLFYKKYTRLSCLNGVK
jgi:hypothetical protein